MTANPVSLPLLLALLAALCRRADGTAFEVGGDEGWVVPPASDDGRFNQWASKNSFRLPRRQHFKYEKQDESVMVVTEDDYNNCRAAHLIFFSNNGDTEVELDRPGLFLVFYFISGVAGHCERGQRMAVEVIGQGPSSPPPAQPSPPHRSGAARGASAIAAVAMMALSLIIMLGV